MCNWIKLNVLPVVGTWIIKLLGRVNRLHYVNQQIVQKLHAQRHGIIFAVWHSQQLLMPLVFPENQPCVLVSQHRDGEIIYRIIKRFGGSGVRGSSSRGGGLALRQLIRVGRSARDILVTPDGPKGPREVVKPGIIHLAKMTGLPIVPLVFACSKKKFFQVGMDLFFRCPLAMAGLSGGIHCGWGRMPMRLG